MSFLTPYVFIQASRTNFIVFKTVIISQILTIEANVRLPQKMVIFRINGKNKSAKKGICFITAPHFRPNE